MNSNNEEIVLLSCIAKKTNLFKDALYRIEEKCYKLLMTIFKGINTKLYKTFRKSLYKVYYRILNRAGHTGITFSLFRGLDNLHINYSVNKITEKTKNAFVVWGDEDDFNYIKFLKQRNLIKKVVTNPECMPYTNDNRYTLARQDYIDRVLVASDWVVDLYKEKNNDNSTNNKIYSWPSGVELPEKIQQDKIHNSCICYLKRVADDRSKVENLIQFIENSGVKCYVLEYPKYDFKYWQKLLTKVDFVIFYQDYHETQGLAIAEAWAHNKPTFIKNTKTSNSVVKNSPYLSTSTGLSWETIEELETIILKYKSKPQEFLAQFTPYNWVKDNMSDETCTKMLLKIFDSIED